MGCPQADQHEVWVFWTSKQASKQASSSIIGYRRVISRIGQGQHLAKQPVWIGTGRLGRAQSRADMDHPCCISSLSHLYFDMLEPEDMSVLAPGWFRRHFEQTNVAYSQLQIPRLSRRHVTGAASDCLSPLPSSLPPYREGTGYPRSTLAFTGLGDRQRKGPAGAAYYPQYQQCLKKVKSGVRGTTVKALHAALQPTLTAHLIDQQARRRWIAKSQIERACVSSADSRITNRHPACL